MDKYHGQRRQPSPGSPDLKQDDVRKTVVKIESTASSTWSGSDSDKQSQYPILIICL